MLDVDVPHDPGDAGEVVVSAGQGTERPALLSRTRKPAPRSRKPPTRKSTAKKS